MVESLKKGLKQLGALSWSVVERVPKTAPKVAVSCHPFNRYFDTCGSNACRANHRLNVDGEERRRHGRAGPGRRRIGSLGLHVDQGEPGVSFIYHSREPARLPVAST